MSAGEQSFIMADQFGWRLARVERNYDQAFGHDREIERDPVDAVVRQQGAAVAFFQPLATRNARACATSFSNPWPPRPQPVC